MVRTRVPTLPFYRSTQILSFRSTSHVAETNRHVSRIDRGVHRMCAQHILTPRGNTGCMCVPCMQVNRPAVAGAVGLLPHASSRGTPRPLPSAWSYPQVQSCRSSIRSHAAMAPRTLTPCPRLCWQIQPRISSQPPTQLRWRHTRTSRASALDAPALVLVNKGRLMRVTGRSRSRMLPAPVAICSSPLAW
jgi:hypothetical protein